MRHALIAVVSAALLAAVPGAFALNSGIPAQGLPTASQYSTMMLPELQGVVSWKTLAAVEPIQTDGKMTPRFSKEILALDRQSVRIQGFVLPMDIGDQQKHFLISAVPPHCPFCLPAGPDAIVEVFAKKPVAYGLEPVIMSGKMAVIRDDAAGLLYRLTDAEPVDTRLPK